MKNKWSIFFCCGAALSIGSFALADTISVRNADGASALTFVDVKVNGVTDGKLNFTNNAGIAVSRPFETVVGLKLDDEPAFNAAEDAFHAGKFDQAVDKYDQTMNRTDKAWLKDYCETKLADSADKSGRFDKAVDSFIRLVKKSPALAAQHKLTAPQPGSTYLDAAAKTITAAVDAPGLKQEQQELLLGLLMNVQKARNDQAAVDAIAARLTGAPAPAPAPGAAKPAAASGVQVDAKLTEITSTITQKKFDDAVNMINSSQAIFTDAPHQAEALWLLAQAREGQAADKGSDNNAWKDAAIAYMRVVANFKELPAKPHVVDALMHVAAIEEKLSLNQKAMETYLGVVKEYNKDPQAAKAQQEADRLKATTKPS